MRLELARSRMELGHRRAQVSRLVFEKRVPLAQFAIFGNDRFGHATHRAQLALERSNAPPRALEIEPFGILGGIVEAKPQPQLFGPRPAASQLTFELRGFVDLSIEPLELIARALGRDVPCFASLT